MHYRQKHSSQFQFIATVFISIILFSCKTEPAEEPTDDSAYISEVFEYVFAPSQYATKAFATDIKNVIGKPSSEKSWLYLGGFGGYVIAGFNHDVMNDEGADFEVFALPGVSPEPAIVYVMRDDNADGKPNETWYELKGNQFENSQRNYWVRYYKASSDSTNITWKDSKNAVGEVICGYGANNSAKWWWPATTADSITFAGTRLPDAYDDNSSEGVTLWAVPRGRFTEGYAENIHGIDYSKTSGGNKLDISNAVDSAGNTVKLSSIRFIKVQTAVFQQAGWTNEVSAEITGAMDLGE